MGEMKILPLVFFSSQAYRSRHRETDLWEPDFVPRKPQWKLPIGDIILDDDRLEEDRYYTDDLNLYDLLGTSLPSSLLADEDDDSDWLGRESFDPRDRILEKILDSEVDPFSVLFGENERSNSDWPSNWSDKKTKPKFDKNFKLLNSEYGRSKKRDRDRVSDLIDELDQL